MYTVQNIRLEVLRNISQNLQENDDDGVLFK